MRALIEARHMPKSKARGPERQQRLRKTERAMRKKAVAFARLMARRQWPTCWVAARLGMRSETLEQWIAAWKEEHLRVKELGRPAQIEATWKREEILCWLAMWGPGIGVPSLQQVFPHVARAELEELIRSNMDAYKTWGARLVRVLRWTRTGAVWAMDYTQPPKPLEGIYKYVLVVRDLASGAILWAMGVREATADATLLALRTLINWYGLPLLIKSDNGSHFTATEVRQFLQAWDILALYSPPGTPEYNGACEAGIGSLTTRAYHEAARHDRPEHWTCDDMELARHLFNDTPNPWRNGMTPDRIWERRTMPARWEGDRFRAAVARCGAEERANRGLLPGVEVDDETEKSIQRVAISRACVALGLLRFSRRRITLRIKKAGSRRIS